MTIEAPCPFCGPDTPHTVLDDDGRTVLARARCCGRVNEIELTPASTSSIVRGHRPSEGTP